MTKQNALRTRPSLLERAAEVYDFSSGLRVAPVELAPVPAAPVQPAPPQPTARPVPEPVLAPAKAARVAEPVAETPADVELPKPVEADLPEPLPAPARRQAVQPRTGTVDRQALKTAGFILPDAPVTGLAEEFRLIKRQLLRGIAAATRLPDEKRQSILVCSSQPDEGKTFCATNLALSLANERDLEVLLVDSDFPKPEIVAMLGLENGPGLVDAIADPGVDPEDFVIRTDLGSLSVLPAGRQENNVPELLASDRTRDVLAQLAGRNPRRVIIFDSPPALMASSASLLSAHVGQVLLVVRADETTEANLRETVALLSGCDQLSLLLNGAGFAATGRRFGSYYGYGQ